MNPARSSGKWTRDLAAAVPPWLVARACVLGALALGRFIFSEALVGASRPSQLSAGLLSWDAGWYARIASHGYVALPREALRFFPLVPILARSFALLLAGNTDLALLLVANGSALAAGALLHRLVVVETHDHSLAVRSVWLLALAPSAAALVMGYAEATLLLLSVGAFLGFRTRRWGWAISAGFLAGLCRPIGVALTIPALIEIGRCWSRSGAQERVAGMAAAAAPIAGTGAYLAWVELRLGGGLAPFRLQQEPQLRGAFVNPLSRLLEAGRDLAGGERFGSGLHLIWALVFLALLAVCFRRLPASYGAFSAAILFVAMSSQNLDSLERYALSAFPLILTAGLLTNNWVAERSALLLSTAALVGYATLIFLARSIP